MPTFNPAFATASQRPTLPEALSGLCLLAAASPREDHGKLIEKFMDINPEIGIHDPKAVENAFRAGFGAGYRRGDYNPLEGGSRAPDEDAALAEYLEGLA
jgi:hypothetical protein